MKKFKQFRAEQQYITEVGPFASAMMTAMGIFGGGVAAWHLFKTAKEKIKGYKESKAEKKDNKASGVFVIFLFCFRFFIPFNLFFCCFEEFPPSYS
jgi:uncharacterized membrane protein YdjX (TVP38/TMEM64 family)